MNEEEQKQFFENLNRRLGITSNWGTNYNQFLYNFSTLPRVQSVGVNDSYEGSQLNPDTQSEWSKKENRKKGELAYKKEKQKEKNQEALQYLNVLSLMDPSRIIGAVRDNKPFVASMLAGNAGLGIPWANDIVDLVTPSPTTKIKALERVGKGFNLLRRAASKINPTRLLRRKVASQTDDLVEEQATKLLGQRDLTQEGVLPYTYKEIFDLDGNLKPEVNFPGLVSGNHGIFYNSNHSPYQKLRSYLVANNPKRTAEEYEGILLDNGIPFTKDQKGRVIPQFGTISGWRVGFHDGEYSPDSFSTLLGMLERNLKAGRQFHMLPKDQIENQFVRANPFNQKSRYNIQFLDKEFEKAFKNHQSSLDFSRNLDQGPVPAGYDLSEVGSDLVFSKNGKEVGKLVTRPLEEVIGPINQKIIRLNKNYNMEIPLAKVENGQIFWPNLEGVLLRRGGNFPSKKIVKLLKRR